MWTDFLSDKKELQQEGIKVLEAMCGFADGKDILERTLDISTDYSGFDYSDTVVSRVRESRPELKVYQQDVTRFQSDDAFDLIILLGGLHHVPHAAAEAVARLAGSLKPGGSFISLEPTTGNWLFKAVREHIYRKNQLFDEQTERDFSVDELMAMFSEAGLSLVDVSYPGLLSYMLYYNPDALPWLNIGGPRTLRAIYALDRLFFHTRIGRALSFASLTLWRKPD